MINVILTNGMVALVDDTDYEVVEPYKWHFVNGKTGGYAVTYIKGKTHYMHRLIMQPSFGMVVDHINASKLDNTRSNLRICTSKQNHANKTIQRNNRYGFKGVSLWTNNYGKTYWRADLICELGGVRKHICKLYKTKIEAVLGWNELARQYYGPFAKLNEV